MLSESQKEFTEIVRLAWPDWEIIEKLGSGAFATVFRASRREKISGEKDSAIKIIRIPQDDSDWDRMLAEGKTAGQARACFQEAVDDSLKEIRAMEELGGNTNIVNIFDYKVYKVPDRNVWYILIRMEYLQKINPDAFDENEIRKLGADVCTALGICRKKNIVHRDVSLDNVFIHDGNYKLGDFGVAKVLEGTAGGMHSIAGKPLYMAPEVYNATITETDMDSIAKVDIYSLGILLYRLSNNMRFPFEDPGKDHVTASDRSDAFRRRVIEGETLPPPANASPEMAAVILKACAANPARRYESADEMRAALLALEPAASRRRFPWKTLCAAAAALAVLAAAYFAFLRPALFPEWSAWSEWSETRREVPDPDQMQEEKREKYEWKAVKCPKCRENNPEESAVCVKCGSSLPEDPGSRTEVYAYSDDITGEFSTGKAMGRYFAGKAYWFNGSTTQYRYRSRNGETNPEEKKTYHITVSAPESMNGHDFETAQKTLRERLDIFTGGRDYGWTPQDGKIELDLPEEAFAGQDIEKVFQCYLTRPIRLYAIGGSPESDCLEIPRGDVESVKLKTGAIDGVNPADYKIETPEYQYLEVVLKDEFAETHKEEFASWDSFNFAQDCEAFPEHYWYHYTVSSGDGKTYYIINNDSGGRFSELVLYNLTHDPLSGALGFSIDMYSLVKWRIPDQTDKYGKYQCGPNQIKTPSVTFSLLHISTAFSEGNKLDTEAVLAKRLDAIGIPYAIGILEEYAEGKVYYFVKTEMTRMGIPVMESLCTKDFLYIRTDSFYSFVSLGDLSCNPGKNITGMNLQLKGTSDYTMDKIRKVAESAAEKDGYLYIASSVFGVPFLAARADTFLQEGVLAVEELCEVQKGRVTRKPLDPETKWMADYLQSIVQTKKNPAYFTLDSYRLDTGTDGAASSEHGFPIAYNPEPDTAEIENNLRKTWEKTTVEANDAYVFVHLNMEPDGQFPESVPELVKNLYAEIDFSSLFQKNLYFLLTEEQDNEWARIYFTKETKSESDGPDSYCIRASGSFAGERLEPYREALYEKIRSMEFYQELSDKYSAWSTDE